MDTHSTILSWRIPWTEEPGGLQSVGSQRVGHDWATNSFIFGSETLKEPWAERRLCKTQSLHMSISDVALEVNEQRKISEGGVCEHRSWSTEECPPRAKSGCERALSQGWGLSLCSPAGVSLFSSTRNCSVLYILIYFEWDILLQLSCPHLTIVRRMLVQEWTGNLIFSS